MTLRPRSLLWVAAFLLMQVTLLRQGHAAPSPSAYHPQSSAFEKTAPRKLSLKERQGKKIVVVPIDKTIELGIAAFLRRAIETHPEAAAIVLDINTLGGRVDAAIQMRDALLATPVPTIAFIHPRAISAGALIALACDQIYITSGATIGAATPFSQDGTGNAQVDEKMISYMRAEMRATAEANQRRGDIAEAMVDPDVEIPGVVEAGKLLTADTQRALDLRIADARADTLDDILKATELTGTPVETLQINWAERIARWLTEPVLSNLLLSVGMLGIMIAFYTRQLGIFTIIGFISLALFFGGHAIADLAGLEEVLIFLVGVALLVTEIFVIPGFGIVGLLGIGLIGLSLVMTLVGMPLDVSFELGWVQKALEQISLSFVIAFAMGLLVAKFLPRTRYGQRLVLATNMDAQVDGVADAHSMIGKSGVTLNELGPSGKVEIDGKRFNAVSARLYIERGIHVKVIDVRGAELVVQALDVSA